MLHVNKRLAQGRGLAAAPLRRAPIVEIDWDTRSKSRFDATDSAGRHLGVFLPRGQVLRVTACSQHGTPLDLPRAAYHLGNRHVALEVQADHLQLEPDPVLADMLRAMHLIVSEANAAFEPESGAYAGDAPGTHGHGHGHDH